MEARVLGGGRWWDYCLAGEGMGDFRIEQLGDGGGGGGGVSCGALAVGGGVGGGLVGDQ